MRGFAFLLILVATACENGHPPHRAPPQNVAQPAPGTPAPPAKAAPVQAAPDDAPPRDDPGLAGLSGAQRRAYELGYRDCAHGRYAPANHLEAYRIGCGAAHDRMEAGRPQG